MRQFTKQRREPDYKLVRSGFAELRQEEHRVEMADEIILGVELLGPLDRFLQDAQQFGCDLFPA